MPYLNYAQSDRGFERKTIAVIGMVDDAVLQKKAASHREAYKDSKLEALRFLKLTPQQTLQLGDAFAQEYDGFKKTTDYYKMVESHDARFIALKVLVINEDNLRAVFTKPQLADYKKKHSAKANDSDPFYRLFLSDSEYKSYKEEAGM